MGGHFAIEVNIQACRLVELLAAELSVNYDKFEVGDFLHAHDILECTTNPEDFSSLVEFPDIVLEIG